MYAVSSGIIKPELACKHLSYLPTYICLSLLTNQSEEQKKPAAPEIGIVGLINGILRVSYRIYRITFMMVFSDDYGVQSPPQSLDHPLVPSIPRQIDQMNRSVQRLK